MPKPIAFKIIMFQLAALCWLSPAFANDDIDLLETCLIDQSIELSKPTQIFCASDLAFADGVEIMTAGFGLQIVAGGTVKFGTDDGLGLRIFPEASPVVMYARTAIGQLSVKDTSDTVNLSGSHVVIEYGSSYNYQQTIEPGFAAYVQMTVAGQELQLVGDQHRLPL